MMRLLNRRFFDIFLIACIIFILSLFFLKYKDLITKKLFSDLKANIIEVNLNKGISKPLPFKKGENLVFRLDLGFFSIGTANLIFEGRTQLDGKEVYLIKFITHVANFYDKENIYAEIDSFLPLRVDRDIKMFGKKINIVEEYNQKEKFVKITRSTSGKRTEQIIRSNKEIDNILCLVYFYRMPNNIEIGEKMFINLPLKQLEMEAKDIKKIEIAKGKFNSYILESKPKGYSFWFDTSPRRLPLRIDGAIKFGNIAMVLSDFN
jgi:hypothetical protein